VFGGDDLTVGRAHDNDIRLTDPTVSRYHLRLMYSDGEPVVVDLNSSNGTYINGVSVRGVHTLQNGDVIEAGDAKLVFRAPASPDRPEAEPPSEVEQVSTEVAPRYDADLDREVPAAEAIQPVAPPPLPRAADSPGVPVGAASGLPPQPVPSAGIDEHDPVTRHEILNTPRGVAVAELKPAGALSIESADRFRALCDELLAAGHNWFLFDLGNIDYLDSTGLAVLLRLSREARSRGGQVWFFAETPAVHSIFELTNLRKVLRIVPERAVALAETEEIRP
jgi:anti-anti-sigma factor